MKGLEKSECEKGREEERGREEEKEEGGRVFSNRGGRVVVLVIWCEVYCHPAFLLMLSGVIYIL